MTNDLSNAVVSDATLVAYLDNEIGAEERAYVERLLSERQDVAARLEHLRGGTRMFSTAFDDLLTAAPVNRLEAALEDAIDQTAPPTTEATRRAKQQQPDFGTPRWGWREGLAIAAVGLLLTFGIGFWVGQGLGTGSQVAQTKRGWIAAVADYATLYDAASFRAAAEIDQEQQAHQLERIMRDVGHDLDRDTQALVAQGARFKFAQLLFFEGKPLAQIAMTIPSGEPFFYCVLPSDNLPKAPETRRIGDQNIVSWADGQHGFVLVGQVPTQELANLAARLRNAS